MTKELEEKLDDLIAVIKNSYEYQQCIEIKKQMDQNKELNDLINKVKKLQQKYIRTQEKNIKEELKKNQEELNQIPIYCEYNQYLAIVNEKIELIKDELNEYFYQKLNGDKNTN